MLPGWKAERAGHGYAMISHHGSGASPGGKRRLIRGGGSTGRISNDVRPQDPGGGEAQLTFSRDVAGEWPVFHPTSRSVTVRPEDVEVTAMSADAARRQVDCALPTDSDRVSLVMEGLPAIPVKRPGRNYRFGWPKRTKIKNKNPPMGAFSGGWAPFLGYTQAVTRFRGAIWNIVIILCFLFAFQRGMVCMY